MATSATGKVFGQLTVLDHYNKKTDGGNYRQILKVECSCGWAGERTIYQLRRSEDPMCPSCHAKKNAETSAAGWKHPLYSKWIGMLSRCHSPTSKGYKWYGLRGIVVCDRWRGGSNTGERGTVTGFRNFVEDMGLPPGEGLTLDRVDNNGPYCKENCRWASVEVQSLNKKNTVMVEYRGGRVPLMTVAKALGVPVGKILTGAKYIPIEEAIAFLEGLSVEDRDKYVRWVPSRGKGPAGERCGWIKPSDVIRFRDVFKRG